MYHIHTKKSSLDLHTFNFLLSQNFSPEVENSTTVIQRLRNIADQAFDLLSQIQKMDKLNKLGHLGESEKNEHQAQIMLVGILIHLLDQYKYKDSEMVDALKSRFQKFGIGLKEIAA